MNYYGGKELAESFRTVRKNTLEIAGIEFSERGLNGPISIKSSP